MNNKSQLHFTIAHNIICQIITGRVLEQINHSYTGVFSVLMPGAMSPEHLIGQDAALQVTHNDTHQFFYFLIKSVRCTGGNNHLYTLEVESPLRLLKQCSRSRGFSHITTQALIEKILTPDVFYLADIACRIQQAHEIHAYIEQQQCTDLAFLERLISTWRLVYYFKADTNKTTLCIEDANSAVNKDTLMTYDRHDIKAWHRIYQMGKSVFGGVSEHPALTPGTYFNFADEGTYRVVSSQHIWDESSAHILGGSEQGMRYQNIVSVVPLLAPIDIHHDQRNNKKHHVPYLTLSAVTTSGDNVLNERGEYHVESHEHVHTVRKVETFVGNDFGMHFPLLDKTPVAIARMEGHPDKPVILGAVYSEIQRNPVTYHNAYHHVIKTSNGHQLLLDENIQTRHMLMETRAQSNQLLLHAADTSSMDMSSQHGSLSMHIAGEIQWHTQKNMVLQTDKAIQCAAKNIHVKSVKENIAIQSGGDVILTSDNHMEVNAEQDLSCEVMGNVSHTIKENYQVVTHGEINMTSTQGQITFNAEQHAFLCMSKKRKLLLNAGESSVSLHESGVLMVCAKQVVLKGKKIEIRS